MKIRLCAFADEYGNSFAEQVEGLKKNEINLIELRNIDGKNVVDLSVDEGKHYYEKFRENGISVWSLGSPLGKVDISINIDEYLQTVRHLCELAQAFHTDKIRAFSFFNAYEKKEEVFSALQKMVAVAAEYGVKLYHENEKEIYGDTLARVMEIYREVQGLGYVYDPANFLQVGETAETTLAALLHKTDYFHVKDVVVATQELVPAGYGDGKIEEILKNIQGDFTFTLEPHLAIFKGYENIDKSEMKNKFTFSSNQEAFCVAAQSFKALLEECGYKHTGYNEYER